MAAHTIVIGYGSAGRSAAHAVSDGGAASGLVVVDTDTTRTDAARREGAAAVLGDGHDLTVLHQAGAAHAARIAVAVSDDHDAVRITSTVRGLNNDATICTLLRRAGWKSLAEYLGADQVVVTGELTGRLLGLSVRRPDLPARFDRALRARPDLVVAERAVRSFEVGQCPGLCKPLVLAVVRGGRTHWRDDPVVGRLRASDQLLVLRASWPESVRPT
ncbi:NAD-binding protein [Nocardia beijingensis]|uniref:NAD-binding protein n=1 Tax=Nocardia beijingensis TaxID=95162 RepID=UPI0018954724|nr:NAD-binding protein [Nocardia beijingensis]MBF6079590.1 NAD-binding protein [Nocardia beijingensis]